MEVIPSVSSNNANDRTYYASTSASGIFFLEYSNYKLDNQTGLKRKNYFDDEEHEQKRIVLY